MLTGILLGVLQGITEWLPVSSEGVVAATYAFALDRPPGEAVDFALWLHLGTSFSVVIALRREVAGLVVEAATDWRRPSPLLRYLFLSTVVSGVVGMPLLLALGELSDRAGAAAMGAVGLLMFVTGGLQLRGRVTGSRGRDQVTGGDAALAGVAQGLAALPGLSRSGLTVAVLLARRLERRDALILSFLMSVPAGLGAAAYAVVVDGLPLTTTGLVAAPVACVVGLITIRALLRVAERVNFAAFIFLVGMTIIGGAVWQGLR